MADALSIRNLAVARAGRQVLREVSLEVPAGEVTALLGPNGAGKSTLTLAVAGVLPIAGGEIEADGRSVAGRRPEAVRGAGVATVPEGHRVLGDLSVVDNLRVATARESRKQRAAAIERVIALFPELEEMMERRAGSLSGGQQQMLAIAQALVGGPRYLIIDELSLGLAPVVVRRLMPAIREVAESGVGVLLIEQFTSLALDVAASATVLVRGRVRLQKSAEELRANPELLAEAYHLTATNADAVELITGAQGND
jgi:branched-chain amino acid transport system ATP-binding protein